MDVTTGKSIGAAYPRFMQELIEDGGLMEHILKRVGSSGVGFNRETCHTSAVRGGNQRCSSARSSPRFAARTANGFRMVRPMRRAGSKRLPFFQASLTMYPLVITRKEYYGKTISDSCSGCNHYGGKEIITVLEERVSGRGTRTLATPGSLGSTVEYRDEEIRCRA